MTFRLSMTSRHLIITGATLVTTIMCAAVWLIWSQRASDLADSQREAIGIAQVLAEQTSRTLQPVDLMLRATRDRLMSTDSQPQDSLTTWASVTTHGWLVEQLKGVPQAEGLAVISADGRVVNFSRQFPAPRTDLSDRDYYKYLSAIDDHALFVSAPIQSFSGGNWTVLLARRINDAHGQFAGIVVASVTLAYLEDFYKAVTPGNRAITLLRRDGTILIHYPIIEHGPGWKLPEEAPWYRLVQHGGGSYRSPGYVDAVARLVSIYPLADFPLVIDSSTTEAAVLSRWRHQTSLLLAGAGIMTVCTVFLLWVFGRQFAWLERSEGSLARQNAELESSRLKFNAVLDNMSQGLTFFGGDRRLNVCNRRFREIYRLSADQTCVGTPLTDVLNHRVASGTFVAMTQADYVARLDVEFQQLKPYDVIDNLSDGRSVSLHFQPMRGGGWVTTHEDITERRRTEASLAFMARHDALTTLPNRTLFQERLEQAVSTARHDSQCALLCLDLDRFKVINDTLGHPIGDELLCVVADRLSECVREVDTVARLGGDEFAVVQVGLRHPEHAALLADRIIAALTQPFTIDGHRIVVGASIGISMAASDGTSPETLLKNADIALYLAKAEHRGVHRFFEADMDAHAQSLRVVELDLRNALPADDFELYYQPIINLHSGKVVGFEALIRWNHPVRGLINPADFIPIAEDTGLIVPIGEWVLRTACLEAAGWPPEINIAVNLSPVQVKGLNLFDKVQQALEVSGLPPSRLILEITESVLMQNSDDRLALLHRFRALGIRIALDDFGTGFSSLSYLRSFPFETIKIDRSFIRDVDVNKDSTVIVGAIIGLASALGMTTIAEGVETERELAVVRDQGASMVQGYLFSRPVPASEVRDLIRTLGARGQHDEAAVTESEVPPAPGGERMAFQQ
jgi:diguanylate cyclase (GGDEF)-like protein